MFSLTPHQINALDTKHSISLTANAGSGKTYVLAKRFLEILLNTDTSIQEIAAITFTEKAAGELYKRIADEINNLSLQKNEDYLQTKLDKLRKQLVSANISTIHSFCVDLLREFPVEASLDANFIPVDQRTANELSELSIETIIKRRLGGSNDKDYLLVLIRLLGSKQALSRELQLAVQKRKNLLSIREKFYNYPDEDVVENIKKNYRDEVKKILKVEKSGLLPQLKIINDKVLLNNKENEIATRVNEILSELEEDSVERNLQNLSELNDIIFTKQGSLKSRDYLGKNLRKGLLPAIRRTERIFFYLKELIPKESINNIDYELLNYTRALLNIFLDVIKEYEYRKNQLGYLDFEDILIKTRNIIKNKDVKEKLNKKFKYLLVDEYQDTNEIQYEVFLPVVDYLKHGNLFIVGDEKQSIYRFRDAELEVFGKTKEDIRKANSENLLLTLPDSFRMSSSICLFTNYLFKNLFNVPQQIYNEVAHSDLVCARTDSFSGKIEFLLSADNENENEAELIAKKIIKLKNENSSVIKKWNNIAVLVRKRASFSELEKAFIKHNIPFSIIGGTGFYQQQSISDIYNYFAFLFNEKDDAAFIGLLRSPFFSVSDTRIFNLSTFKGDSFWDKMLSASESGDFWNKIYNAISENLKLAKRTDVPSILRKILSETAFIPTIASRKNGEQEISNLNKLISITLKFFNQEFNTLFDFLSFLKNSIHGFEEEAQGAIDFENDAVNLMTIHQAKGLEYDAVFLYRCDETVKPSNIKSKSFTIDKKFGILAKVPPDENYFETYHSPDIVKLFNFIENKKTTAELKRLLYVGITRAKNFLFISMREKAASVLNLNSFSSLINEELNIDYSKDSFTLSSDLKFLEQINGIYKTVSRNHRIEIPVTKELEQEAFKEELDEKVDLKQNILLSELKDRSEGEIISATKFSIFSNCQRKYNLTYNINMNDLIRDYKKWLKVLKLDNDFEFNSSEQQKILFEESNFDTLIEPDIKGRIIHKLLQKNIRKDDLEQGVNELLQAEKLIKSKTKNSDDQLKENIISVMKKFIHSEEYEYINSFKDFKNEFEVYYKLSDFYLFGIIDKAIFTKNKIIVIDFKTDNIIELDLPSRAQKYVAQLNFYSFILKRMYKNIGEIEMRIDFTNCPEKPFIKKFTKNDEIETESKLEKMITAIRNNNYSVNLEHCSECVFTLKNNMCVLNGEKNNVYSNVKT